MEDSWESCISALEMDDDNFFGQCHMNSIYDEKFLTEIAESVSSLHHHSPCPSSTIQYNTAVTVAGGGAAAATTTTTTTDSSLSCEDGSFERRGTLLKDDSSNFISQDHAASHKVVASSPTTFIWSLENSTVEPAMHRPSQKQDSDLRTNYEPFGGGSTRFSPLSSKRTLNNHIMEPEKNLGTKKVRRTYETLDHIMAERKRRQELAERFIALSATIPGLKKTDKAYILREAINYVKQLQGRVQELENQNKRTMANSVVYIKKSQVCTKEESSSCKTNADSCYRYNKGLPQVEARVLEKQVLIGIHCEKQKDIVLKIVASLKNLHLSLASSSILPFGTSILKVSIIAQMGDKYCMTVNDLVKNLRQNLLRPHDMQQ